MNYGNIKYNDVANGPGLRVSLFVSGCTHHCKDCFNQDTWDFNYGKPFGKEAEDVLLRAIALKKKFSLLGGEPFDNPTDCLRLLIKIKTLYPDTSIWCWSGYTFEQILKMPNTDAVDMLSYIDVLVDGKFNIDLKDVRLKFRGSSNQRIIDVPESIIKNKVILKEV